MSILGRFRTEDGKLGCLICGLGWPEWLLQWHMRRMDRKL